jgi:hypothetical protein
VGGTQSLRPVSPDELIEKIEPRDKKRYGFNIGHGLDSGPKFTKDGNGKFVRRDGSDGRIYCVLC